MELSHYRMTSGSGQLYVLSPNQSILYTWDSPAGKRELKWQVIGAQEMTWYPLILEQVHSECYIFYVIFDF